MIYYFALLSICMSFIIAFYNWKVDRSALYIAGVLIILSSYALTHFYTDPSQSDFSLAITYGILSPLWLLPGPFLFFYFRKILSPTKSHGKWRAALHYLPSLIHFLNLIPYLLSPFAHKLAVAHAIHENLNNIQHININSLYSFKIAFFSRPVSLLIYLIICSIWLIKKSYSIPVKTRIWLAYFVICILFTTSAYFLIAFRLVEFTHYIDSYQTNPLYLSSGLAYIFLPISLILFFPEVLYGIHKKESPPAKELVELNEEEKDLYESIALRIISDLQTRKPFLDPSFDLADLSKQLDVPKNQISWVCKHLLGKKFTDLRTHYRITYAKELLDQGLSESITIDGIGSKSGFKSRSTFYEAFKAETGMTPSQYLENLA